jgi:hypothetical protein
MAKTTDELEADKQQREALEVILTRLRTLDTETRRRILETALVFYGLR